MVRFFNLSGNLHHCIHISHNRHLCCRISIKKIAPLYELLYTRITNSEETTKFFINQQGNPTMRILKLKPLYLPALFIVTTIFLLAIFIGVSTYRNLNRDKERANELLEKQAIFIIRSIEMQAKMVMLLKKFSHESLSNLLDDAASDKDVAYISLNKRNNTVFFSGCELIFKQILVFII